jgi:hypothetical protein
MLSSKQANVVRLFSSHFIIHNQPSIRLMVYAVEKAPLKNYERNEKHFAEL